jgi:hypothetical protein
MIFNSPVCRIVKRPSQNGCAVRFGEVFSFYLIRKGCVLTINRIYYIINQMVHKAEGTPGCRDKCSKQVLKWGKISII